MNVDVVIPDALRPIGIARRGDVLIVERGRERQAARADSAAEAKEVYPRLVFWAGRVSPFTGAPWDLVALLDHVDAEQQAMRARARRIGSNARYRARKAA